MYHKPGKGVRNNCNSWLLQFLRTVRSTSRGMLFLGRPEPPFRTGLCSARDVFLGSHIFKVPRPIAAKLCHMIGIWFKRSRKFL